jgi:hypothetical protein
MSEIRDLLISTIKVYPERSRLEFGGCEVSFHCDKFNTRVVKGLEDVIGFEEAKNLLSATSEKTHYDMLKSFLIDGAGKEKFSGLSPEDRLAAVFDVFKVFAYGAFNGKEVKAGGGKVTSPTSYVAEGWLENLERWKWKLRDNPVCHDACGQIAAALSIVYDKPIGTYKVNETRCRAKGDDICEFTVEVK